MIHDADVIVMGKVLMLYKCLSEAFLIKNHTLKSGGLL